MNEKDISRGMRVLGRAGLAARGVVYLVVGGLATTAGLGLGGGKLADQGQAVRTLGRLPFGDVVLWIVGGGLAAYVLWRFGQVVSGSGGGDDARGWRKRAVAFVSGTAYAGLSFTAFSQALGRTRRGRGGGSAQQDGAEWLMTQPLGRWLVAALGGVIIGAALFQFSRAITASFAEHLRGSGLSDRQEEWACRAGRAGFAARGTAFAVIGWFFLQAALKSDAVEAGGLGAALRILAAQPSGPVLLVLVGAGLAFFGVYSLIEARYRRID